MAGRLFLHLLFQVLLLFDALGWEVKMPKEIHGLQGSCLVIPCHFSYTINPPQNPRRVVWYQWVSKGYPLVYDSLHVGEVIEKFRGKTDLYSNSSWHCSLLIRNLEQSHHGEKIYAWIDPENIGWRTYAFYDVTSTILVDAHPQPPMINIYGGEKIGETITVVCSTFHTCPYSKPNITLNGIEGSDETDNKIIKDGLWKISLTRRGVIKTEILTIECSVTFYGGTTVTATKDTNAQLYFNNEADPLSFGPKSVGLYILAPLFTFILGCIIVGYIIYKKRHRQPLNVIQEPQSVQRRSRWSGFSRAGVCTTTVNKPFSKPRMPSPKSEPKFSSGYDYDVEYANMDELNNI